MYQIHRRPIPCLHCHPHSYIRMVQHMIEKCLLLHMDRDQCIKALAEHASVRPLVTLTVWRELTKENRDFFQMYFHGFSKRPYFITGKALRRNKWR
ncbi:Angiotensin-converting enzyme 2 [Bertholletia excelsa]